MIIRHDDGRTVNHSRAAFYTLTEGSAAALSLIGPKWCAEGKLDGLVVMVARKTMSNRRGCHGGD